MKFTLSWLKTHLDTDAPLQQITDTLTRIGLELERVQDRGAALAPFRIARVIEAVQHPNADRLRVCTVDTGDGTATVVCGAPNARTGMKGVFAPPGTCIPGTGITLKVGEIRGVSSAGMLLSERELGLSDEHSGIVDLPDDAPVGTAYAEWAGLNDPVIDVSVTPNRGDCFSVRGIARDLAAAGIGTLKPWQPAKLDPAFFAGPRWQIDMPEVCPWILGRTIRNVQQRPKPAVAPGPPALHRPASDQRPGGHHQLLHHRPRPSAARIRRDKADRRRAQPASGAERDLPRPERQRLHRHARGLRHLRRGRRAIHGRRYRRRGHRL